MHQTAYEFKKIGSCRYEFFSTGKREILKAVQFTPFFMETVYNLAFGDVTSNGEIDDPANSNNNDIIKVFATIIDIVEDFVNDKANIAIFFNGSTNKRTFLYNRLLRMYYQDFSENFIITAVRFDDDYIIEVPFDPKSSTIYMGFFVKKII